MNILPVVLRNQSIPLFKKEPWFQDSEHTASLRSQSKWKDWDSVLSLKTTVLMPSTHGTQVVSVRGASRSPLPLWYFLPGNRSVTLLSPTLQTYPFHQLLLPKFGYKSISISQYAILCSKCVFPDTSVFSLKYLFCHWRASSDSLVSANVALWFLSGRCRNSWWSPLTPVPSTLPSGLFPVDDCFR